MSVMVQLRHVPASLHQELKKRAADARMSLSDYAILELKRALSRPTNQSLLSRLQLRQEVDDDLSDVICEALDEVRDR